MRPTPIMSSNMASLIHTFSAAWRQRHAQVKSLLLLVLLLVGSSAAVAQTVPTKFSMQLNSAAYKTSLTKGVSLDLSTVADITGGTAEVVNPNSNPINSAEVIDSKSGVLHVKLNQGAYIHIELNRALAEGDTISFLSYNKDCTFKIGTAATAPGDGAPTATASTTAGTDANGITYYSGSYIVGSSDAIKDQTNIYLWDSNAAYIRSLTITPKCYKYTLNASLNGTSKVIASGYVGDVAVTVFYPLIIKYNNTFYKLSSTTSDYSVTFSSTKTNETISYTANSNIKGFIEGEKADYAANANNKIYSDGDYGYVAGRKAATVVENLPAGQYTYHAYYVSNGNRSLVLRDLGNTDVESNTVANLSIDKNSTKNTEYTVNFNIYGIRTLGITGYTTNGRTNQSADFDYAYIEYNGSVIPLTSAEIKDMTVDYNSNANDGWVEVTPTSDKYTPLDATDKTFIMTSSDPTVVSVDNTNHKVKGLVAGGSAVITAKFTGADNLTKTFNVFVRSSSEESNLTEIDKDFTFTPTSSLSDKTLYADNKILSIGSNSYNSGGVRVKNQSCAIAFKVKSGALIKVTFSNHTNNQRTAYIHNAKQENNSVSNPLASDTFTGTKTLICTSNSDQTIYLYANNTDLYVNQIEVYYSKYTVTYSVTNGTLPSGTPSTAKEATPTAGVTLPSVTPNTGYAFAGWSTNSAAVTPDAGAADATYYPTKDITLYAVCIATQTLQSVTVNGHTLVATEKSSGASENDTYSYTIGTAWSNNTIPVTITPAPTAKATVGNTVSSDNGQPIIVDVPINGQPQTISVQSGNDNPSTYYIKVNSAAAITVNADHYAIENKTYYEGQEINGTHIKAWISTTAGGDARNSANSNYGELATVALAQTYSKQTEHSWYGNNTVNGGDIDYSYRIVNSWGNNPVYNSNGVPSGGAYYAFTPTVDGVLEVSVNIGRGKQLFVSDGSKILSHANSSVASDLATADYITSFTISNDTTTTVVDAGSIRINVSANKTYYVYGGNTKMGLLGFALNEYYYLKTGSETFTLSEENLDKYAFFTKENAATTRSDYGGVTISRVKKETDKVSVKVKGASSFAGIVYNSGGSGRKFKVYTDFPWTSGEMIAGNGETTSEYCNILPSAYTVGIAGASSDVYGYQLIFLQVRPSKITIKKGDTEVTSDDLIVNHNTTYTVTSNNTNSSTPIECDSSGVSSFAKVTFSNGTLTIKPKAGGSGFIKFTQDAYNGGGNNTYDATERLFYLTVRKRTLFLTMTHGTNPVYSAYTKADDGTHTGSYYSGESATSDGGTTTPWTITTQMDTLMANTNPKNKAYPVTEALAYEYYSDDKSIATIDENSGAVTLQSGANGTANLTVYYPGNDTLTAAKAQYTITVTKGYNVKIEKKVNDKYVAPKVNEKFAAVKETKNGNGEVVSRDTLMTMITCGYKYHNDTIFNLKDSWEKNGPSAYEDDNGYSCQIDGFIIQSQAAQDSRNEFNQKIDWTAANKADTVYRQRVKPFSLPIRGAYLKFEPTVNGVLTAYVLQNGDITMDNHKPTTIGGLPRIYYWFDQDGYRIPPVSVTSKLPLCYGRDYTDENDVKVFDNPDSSNNLTKWYSMYKDMESLYTNADDPQWPTQAQVEANLAKIMPDPQPVVRLDSGFCVHQKAYVKYVLNVVAGNTYYFFSNNSKVGAVGYNFQPASTSTITCKAFDANGTKHDLTVTKNSTSQALDQTVTSVTTLKPTTDYKINQYDEITFNRTFKVNTWNTITLPFPLTETQVEKVFGVGTILVTYNGVAQSGGHNTAFFLRHVDQNILAGQPYFIKPTGKGWDGNDLSNVSNSAVGGNGGLTFKGVNVSFNLAAQNYEQDTYKESGSCAYKDTDLRCVGTLAKTNVATGDYFINVNSGDLVEYTGTGTQMNAYRAFLKQSGTNPVKLTSVNYSGLDGVDWEAEATGIMEVLVNDMGVEIAPVQGVFNLNGQKVGDSTKGLPAGLYIVNGKVINIK